MPLIGLRGKLKSSNEVHCPLRYHTAQGKKTERPQSSQVLGLYLLQVIFLWIDLLRVKWWGLLGSFQLQTAVTPKVLSFVIQCHRRQSGQSARGRLEVAVRGWY